MKTRTALVLLLTVACVPEGRDVSAGDADDRHLSVEAINDLPRDGAFVALDPIETGSAQRVTALVVLGQPGDAPRLEARLDDGDWRALDVTWSEADHHVAVVDFDRPGDVARLRIETASLELLQSVRWTAVERPGEDAPEGVDVTSSGLRSELSGLSIVTRADWGARAPRCSMRADPNKTRMAIHHTEGAATNPARQLRSIQQFHANRGWCDVGYHFLIDTSGTIYEGRELGRRGVHARNSNTNNIGIAHIGNFIVNDPPSAMTRSTSLLIARLASMYGIDVARTRIKGHREYSSTDCPGGRLYTKIDTIIADARAGTSPAPPPPTGDCTHSLGGRYVDLACSQDYQCCGGQWRTKSNGCGACVCTEVTGQSGCQAPTPPPPPPPPPTGASCTHSFGGTYTHLACSADYQCCDGAWSTKASGCGSCACTETTGQTGCGAPPPPPAGASCTHSYGGAYAHLACSTSYQCCDGSWRSRAGGGCGVCICEEGTGTQGCGGGTTPPPMTSSPNVGLTLDGSNIPRAGLANATLRNALGIATEPLGTVVTHEGVQWVRGKVSSFGGPNDTGVSSSETGAITGERLRSLNAPMRPSASMLAARPGDYYYAAMRWAYSPNGRSFWSRARFVVVAPSTGRTIVVRAVDWGPHTRTGRVLDLSPQALADLGLSTDDDALVAFAPEGTPLGVVR